MITVPAEQASRRPRPMTRSASKGAMPVPGRLKPRSSSVSGCARGDVALEHDRAAGELARRLLGVADADPAGRRAARRRGRPPRPSRRAPGGVTLSLWSGTSGRSGSMRVVLLDADAAEGRRHPRPGAADGVVGHADQVRRHLAPVGLDAREVAVRVGRRVGQRAGEQHELVRAEAHPVDRPLDLVERRRAGREEQTGLLGGGDGLEQAACG